jgi:hypothetical protein
MGNIQGKCSCLFKKDEKETYAFEEQNGQSQSQTNIFNNTNQSINNQDSLANTNAFKENLLSSKNRSKSKVIQGQGFQSRLSSDKVNFLDKKASFLIANGTSKEAIQLQSCLMIQRFFRGYKFRKEYKSVIKKKLSDIRDKLFDKYTLLFRTALLFKVESSRPPFDKEGWKQHYPLDCPLFKYNYGSIVPCKIFISSDESSIYSGQVNLRGEKHGIGTQLSVNGIKYHGCWRNDNFTGWGRYIDSDGTFFQGYFQDGVLQGKGERHSMNESHYTGEFKNGLKHGFGTEETSEHIYTGNFLNDKKEGQGKLAYKQIKDEYEGEFRDNAITGMGFYTWANQDTFKGTFLKGKMHGRGLYKWPDGGEYEGEYINNIKEGQGRFKWSNGKIFEGPFKNGRPNGIGKLFIDNNIYEVEFSEGKLKKTLSKKPQSSPKNNLLATKTSISPVPKSINSPESELSGGEQKKINLNLLKLG